MISTYKAKLNQLDFYENSIHLTSVITCLLIIVFVPLRWINGDIAQLKINLLTLFTMILINLSLFNNKTKSAKLITLAIIYTYLIGSALISGPSHIYWYYPITTLVFFILPPKKALIATTLLISIVGLIILNELNLIEWVKIILSTLSNILIAYIFCSKTHHHINTLGTQAMIDELSGLSNRRSFDKALSKHAVPSSSSAQTNYLMLLDIDNFKYINDSYGHIVGDNVIKHFSNMIQKSIPENSLAFRLGGDEFAIIFQSSEVTQAMILAEKMRQQMKGNTYINALDSSNISYTTSIGVAVYELDRKKWYSNADKALYRAKRDGKDKVSFFEA